MFLGVPKRPNKCLVVVNIVVSLRPELTIKFIITMNDLKIIQEKIYEIRGQKVMLDRDLAELYGVETKVLNQAVKRNIRRFPDDFMFQLSKDEFTFWKSQIVTSKKEVNNSGDRF